MRAASLLALTTAALLTATGVATATSPPGARPATRPPRTGSTAKDSPRCAGPATRRRPSTATAPPSRSRSRTRAGATSATRTRCAATSSTSTRTPSPRRRRRRCTWSPSPTGRRRSSSTRCCPTSPPRTRTPRSRPPPTASGSSPARSARSTALRLPDAVLTPAARRPPSTCPSPPRPPRPPPPQRPGLDFVSPTRLVCATCDPDNDLYPTNLQLLQIDLARPAHRPRRHGEGPRNRPGPAGQHLHRHVHPGRCRLRRGRAAGRGRAVAAVQHRDGRLFVRAPLSPPATLGGVPRVVILDYGSGNLRSAERALRRVGADVEVTADHRAALAADALVVPGVGAYAACMTGLRGARRPDHRRAARRRPSGAGHLRRHADPVRARRRARHRVRGLGRVAGHRGSAARRRAAAHGLEHRATPPRLGAVRRPRRRRPVLLRALLRRAQVGTGRTAPPRSRW